MARRFKVHLHSEQFDGHLHAACGVEPKWRYDGEDKDTILSENAFYAAAHAIRCRVCEKHAFPYGVN